MNLAEPLKASEIFMHISREEKLELTKPWELAVTCKVMGRSFSQDFLKVELGKIWNWSGSLKLITVGKGFYTIKGKTTEPKSSILVGGPYFILGCLLWVQPWTPRFQSLSTNVNQFLVWIHLPGLPMEFYRSDMLEKMEMV